MPVGERCRRAVCGRTACTVRCGGGRQPRTSRHSRAVPDASRRPYKAGRPTRSGRTTASRGRGTLVDDLLSARSGSLVVSDDVRVAARKEVTGVLRRPSRSWGRVPPLAIKATCLAASCSRTRVLRRVATRPASIRLFVAVRRFGAVGTYCWLEFGFGPDAVTRLAQECITAVCAMNRKVTR